MVVGIACYGLILLVWFAMRNLVTHTYEVNETLLSLATNWLTNSPAFVLYVGKALLPFNLSVYPNLSDHSLIPGAISILIFAGAWFYRKPTSARTFIWGLAWFFFLLAPTFLSGSIFHEHRAYCSFVGLLFAVLQLPLVKSIDFSKSAGVLASVSVLALYSVVAMIHSEQFSNRTAYATTAYSKDPSVDQSYAALAGLFLDEGNDGEAERVLQKAIARDPRMKTVHRMLGDIFANRHEYTLAEREYETSIRIDPLQLYNYVNYGKMLLSAGRNDDAARMWKKSVAINPEFFLGYYYLANYYIRVKNDPDSAMHYVQEIQQRGVRVMPELLHSIEANPAYEKRRR